MSITLYVNGDSHTAGTYTNYTCNLKDCATALLAKKYNLNYINRARGGGSNDRIIRISKNILEGLNPKKTVVLIGWTTFERTEWFEDGIWHQICGQPWYEVQESLRDRWEKHIKNSTENYYLLDQYWQEKIYNFHIWLKERKFVHRFYHAHSSFNQNTINWPEKIWLNESAYNPSYSFTEYSLSLGFQSDDFFHFDFNAHKKYSELLEPSLIEMLREINDQ